MVQKCQLVKKNGGVYGHLRYVCHNIKVYLLNVKDPKISYPKCFFISLHKITKMGKILAIFAIF
jgi:hypothetical protein